jgi:hypothetical protein
MCRRRHPQIYGGAREGVPEGAEYGGGVGTGLCPIEYEYMTMFNQLVLA